MKRSLVLLSLFVASAAGADVLVTVGIESPQMMRRYTPRTAEVEQAIAAELAVKLPGYFRHWSYAGAPSASNQDYSLHFSIEKQGGDQVVTLKLNAKGEVGGTWTGVWMPAGELAARGFPDRATAGAKVAKDIARLLLDKHQAEIAGRMKAKVPVATAAQWQRVVGRSEEPRLVLPLRWPGSRGLVNSSFLVKCVWRGKGPVELKTLALDTPALYDDAASQSRYEALTLKPLMRIFGADRAPVVPRIAREVRKLEPIVVYLDNDDSMGLHMAGGAQ